MASSYDITMRRYNGSDWDYLLPKPQAHADTHLPDGTDPIDPVDLGAVTSVNGVSPTDGEVTITIDTDDLEDDAVTEDKIESGAVSTTYTATLTTSWSGSSAPYSQSITVSGLLASDTPIVDLVPSSTYSTAENQIEGWGYIYRMVTSANTLTVYATDAPEVALPIQIKCIRK